MKNFQVLCHDHQEILNGTFARVTETGGELVMHHESADPVFAIKSQILLDILDQSTGESTQVRARLARAIRAGRSWIYLVRWQQCPSLLKSALKKSA